MISKEENDLLTQTDRGTPMGELMRRYWQPVALSEELSERGAPIPVKIMGEELVLFRDEKGKLGLLGIHCSHRGADLSYGRVEDGGLRCIYHGWLFNAAGKCLDQPWEPGGGEHRDQIQHTAYPCHEQAGGIFAYMGPGEPPLFPNYEFLMAPAERTYTDKLFHEANYLQMNEGSFDIPHLSFLHYTYYNQGLTGRRPTGNEVLSEKLNRRGAAPGLETIDAELTDYGVRNFRIRRDRGPDEYHLQVNEFVLPNLIAFPGGLGTYGVNWHVPIDDRHHWKFTFMFSRERAFDKEFVQAQRTDMTPDFRSLRNKSNRYRQNRESMQQEWYCGIARNFGAQDLCVIEGAGYIQDRTQEHLASGDMPIIVARKVRIKAIRDLQEGREPKNVVRDPAKNQFRIVSTSQPVSSSIDWKDYAKQLEADTVIT
jgi:phenylpropionate dioxygenase-like ring-hydroxylating dioxygenase large terminal subunit